MKERAKVKTNLWLPSMGKLWMLFHASHASRLGLSFVVAANGGDYGALAQLVRAKDS